jgi:hypothetical protein
LQHGLDRLARLGGPALNTIYVDAQVDDAERRRLLHEGQLLVYSPTPNSLALVQHAREMIEEAFGEHFPPTAQEHYEVEEYAQILSDLKPAFIHHPKSKEYIQGLMRDLGCDPDKTYFDVPRMRSSTSDNYLTSGIAYAFHPHRDTWYSAPQCQLNWWLPIYPVESDNVMAFHPRYWTDPVKNSSRDYNYYQWNATSRKEASKHVKKDTRKQPKPEEPMELDPQGARGDARRRRTRVLRRSDALERAEHLRQDALQHRLPHGQRGRPRDGQRGPEHRLGVHGHDAARLPARDRSRTRPGGARRQVRRRDRRRGRARLRVQGVD